MIDGGLSEKDGHLASSASGTTASQATAECGSITSVMRKSWQILKMGGAILVILTLCVFGFIPFLALCLLTLFCDSRKLRDV